MQKQNRTERRSRSRSRLLGAAAGAIALCTAAGLLTSGAQSADDGATRIADTRETLARWVETRKVISKEKRDWALGKEMLGDRIDLVSSEIASLRARLGDTKASIAETDEKRASLMQDNDRLKHASASLADTVSTLETRTRELLARMPDRVREHVVPLSQRLPDDPDNAKESLSQRFQNVVGILNELNKANREVIVASEVRTLADGTSAEVAALYVGVGQAYYATVNGTDAGTGTPGPDGWKWAPANDAAAAITAAIAILRNEQVAGFERLPVRIQ